MLVLQRRMSQGALISFMLYQGSLSSAFDSLGYCFTGMSAAVGAQSNPVLQPSVAEAYQQTHGCGAITASCTVCAPPRRREHGLAHCVQVQQTR